MITASHIEKTGKNETGFVSSSSLFWIYLIFFVNYTEGFWTEYVSESFQSVIELIFIAFIAKNTSKWLNPSCAGKLTCFWLGISLFLGAITWSIIPMLKEIRFFLYYILIFRIFWHEIFSIAQFKKLIFFIITLILSSGCVSLFRTFALDLREERLVGIISASGGTTATSFPMLICSLLTVFFMFYNPDDLSLKDRIKKYSILLLLLLSVFMIGYGSGKRAVLILAPLSIFVTILTSSFYIKKKVLLKKVSLLLIVVFSLNTFLLNAFYHTHGFNYVIAEGDSWQTVLQGIIEYTNDYEFSESREGTMGRLGSSLEILYACMQDNIWLRGIGYHSYKDENTRDFLNIVYGICGWSRDMINGGIFAVLFSIFIYIKLVFSGQTNGAIWKHIRIVILINFLCIYFFYSSDYAVSLKLNMLVALLLALANSPNYKNIRTSFEEYMGYNHLESSNENL